MSENLNSLKWATLSVSDRAQARRNVVRLKVLGVAFQVVADGNEIRILVEYDRVDEALAFLKQTPEVGVSAETKSRRQEFILMAAIAIGMFLGSLFCLIVGIESPSSLAISGISGFGAMVVAHLLGDSSGEISRT